MGQDDGKNLILAAVLSMLVVFGYMMLFPPEAPPPVPEQQSAADGTVTADGAIPPVAGTSIAPVPQQTRETALATGPRIAIETPSLKGAIRVLGGRIDDLQLLRYNVELNDPSEKVTLLNPAGTISPYYIDYGWLPTQGSNPGPMPAADTPWTVVGNTVLGVGSPVTLEWDNAEGLIFTRTLAIDEQYMFTVNQSFRNTTDAPVTLAPYGKIVRTEGDSTGMWILHEGGVGVFDDELTEVDYSDLDDLPINPNSNGRTETTRVESNGWLGFTDKYWMTSLAAGEGKGFFAIYQTFLRGGVPEYQAILRSDVVTAAPGASANVETMLFAGAKEYDTLTAYQSERGIAHFDDAIDWGWFYFLTKPIFQLLHFIQGMIGNMGVAIIVLTLIIKSVLFPLAYKSYVSMSKMKKLQPDMEKIKERAGDDRQKLQQEMMALYKKEKVNPASGCLPILLQIPIFFSLYKVLFVTIEMRHQPFALWINDLSAPDPTSWMNLFGALPYVVPEPGVGMLGLFSIGVFPILMGVTMWLQQKLNPAPTDPTQAMIFAWMPWMFMFMLGTFASGLVIYWVANNTITFLQQYIIMRTQGVDVDILGNIKSGFKKRKAAGGK